MRPSSTRDLRRGRVPITCSACRAALSITHEGGPRRWSWAARRPSCSTSPLQRSSTRSRGPPRCSRARRGGAPSTRGAGQARSAHIRTTGASSTSAWLGTHRHGRHGAHLDAGQVHYEWNNASRPASRSSPATRWSSTRATPPTGTTRGLDPRGRARPRALPRASLHRPRAGPRRRARRRARGRDPRDEARRRLRLDGDPARARPPPRERLREALLQIWDLSDGQHARMGRGIAVPIEAFPGVMGTALDEPGGHSTMPPRKNGGNMDVKQLTAGRRSTCRCGCDGALFSVGDGHGGAGRRRSVRHRRRDERAGDAPLRPPARPPPGGAAPPHDAPARRGTNRGPGTRPRRTAPTSSPSASRPRST